MNRTTLLSALISISLTAIGQSAQIDDRYWLGADISTANGMAARGATLLNYEGDKEYELTELMKVLGLDAVRYRVWVNPGHGWGRPVDGNPHAGTCDKEDLLANCLRAKQLGMAIMISFHYSDTWADPKHQPIPRAWMGHSYKEMLADVANHTTEVLQLLKDNGVEPKWVQVGNETRNGLLWNPAPRTPGEAEGGVVKVAESMGHSVHNPHHYAGFIKAGCDAAKRIFPNTITIVHLDNGYDSEMYDRNLGLLKQGGVQYDMVGMSLYPYWAKKEGGRPDADGVIDDCVRNILHVHERFGKESMIVETGFEDSSDPLVIEESYRQFSKALRDTRDKTDGHCHGIFYWAPESRPGGYNLGAFGTDRRPTKIMKVYQEAVQDQAAAPGHAIVNDTFWHTTDGLPIYSQGGGIFRFPDPLSGRERYYWYGVHYRGAEVYAQNPTQKFEGTGFKGISCYVSDNLTDWTFVRDVATTETISHSYWVGRLGVARLEEAQLYALLVQYNSSVLILTSNSPEGPFQWHRTIEMTDRIGTPNTGDQTVFTDPDTGMSYLIYSNAGGRNRTYISEIVWRDGQVTLLDSHLVFEGAGREGNCMFKHAGHYYLCASNLYGWNASHVYYLEADNIMGPYRPTNQMTVMPGAEMDYGHVTQTGFFYTVRGSKQETVIYCGDRWADFAGNGNGFNQWVPISFTADGLPFFNSLSHWHLNHITGEWRVGRNNNYVRNGSFEADRVSIPSSKKPVQDFILGWTTETLRGNPVAVGADTSPVLNAKNTPDDRAVVQGNHSLLITDRVPFRRRVTQQVASTPFVPLEPGIYTLKAMARSSGDFHQLYIYAKGKKRRRTDITHHDDAWHEITVSGIQPQNGKIEIGIYADGEPNATCRMDDIQLYKSPQQ